MTAERVGQTPPGVPATANRGGADPRTAGRDRDSRNGGHGRKCNAPISRFNVHPWSSMPQRVMRCQLARRMQPQPRVPAVPTPGKADVTHHTNEPTAGDQNAKAMLPHFIEFVMEGIVICD